MDKPTLKKLLHRLLVIGWYSLAGIIVLSAVLLTLARLLLPLAENYRVEIEQALTDYAGQPVSVENIEAAWVGIQPQLKFSNVRLYDQPGGRVQFEFAQARMGIDLVASVLRQDFVPSGFIMRGINLSVTRHADGSFSIEGLSQPKDQPKQDYTQAFVEWLLRQSDIGIESSTLSWTDEPLGEIGLVFTDVNLRLRNDADSHNLDASAGLPARLGKRLVLALDMTGNATEPASWSGDAYLEGDALQLPAWWREQLGNGVKLAGGVADLELWGSIEQASLRKLEGELRLAGLAFDGGRGAAIGLTGLEADVLWSQAASGWNLHLARFRPSFADRQWPSGSVTLHADTTQQRYALVVDNAELADVMPVATAFAPLEEKQLTMFDGLAPAATLKNLSLLYSPAEDGLAHWHIDTGFSQLAVNAWQDIPGVTGLAGKFVADDTHGSLALAGKAVSIDAGELFRDSMRFDELAASLQWSKQANGWQVRAGSIDVKNPDISLRSQFELLLPADGSSPVIDLLADFENGIATSANKYLPVPFLDPETTAWLDKSIVSGTSPAGKVVLRGPLDKFPFDHGEGRFEVRFDVVDGALDYEPGWPIISDMQGEVVFSGRSMDIVGKQGRIYNAHVHDVTAHIDDIDLDEPILELQGHVDADASDVIRFIVESGVASGYSDELKKLTSKGKTAIYLDISLPTVSGDGTVKGHAMLDKARFEIREHDVALDAVTGKLQVSNDGVSGKGLKGKLFGEPVSLKVSHDDDASTALSLKARGRFDLNRLLVKNISKDIPVIAKGESDWLADLSFRNPGGDRHPVTLELRSDMRGTVVELPEPFAKQAAAVKPLLVVANLGEADSLHLEVDYGDDIGMIVALAVQGKQFSYAGSSVAFGGELPVPPTSPRLTITGQLDALSLDAWQRYLQANEFPGLAGKDDKHLSWLEHVNLRVDALQAMGSSFSIKRFRFENEPDFEHWHAYIDADRARGEIRIPYDTSVKPIAVDMAELRIDRSQADAGKVSYDPRKLPPLQVKIAEFVFDGAELGELSLNTSRSDKGVFMDKLLVIGGDIELTASGGWEVEGEGQLTRLTAKLKSDRFSRLLEDLGYSPGFEAGKSRNTAQLEWSGNPLQFNPANLNGTLRIKILDGQLLDVSPGAGRIFGLLSLQALPRRLTLDFSDLFKKGFSFDRINGSFRLEQGDAYTTDLYLDGPSARLDVSGRTGLASRDYDQLITVTPKLTESFSVIGTLLGGPAVGIGAYAVDKLLSPAIQDITSYQYAVTGSWDDPQVEKLARRDVSAGGENEAATAP